MSRLIKIVLIMFCINHPAQGAPPNPTFKSLVKRKILPETAEAPLTKFMDHFTKKNVQVIAFMYDIPEEARQSPESVFSWIFLHISHGYSEELINEVLEFITRWDLKKHLPDLTAACRNKLPAEHDELKGYFEAIFRMSPQFIQKRVIEAGLSGRFQDIFQDIFRGLSAEDQSYFKNSHESIGRNLKKIAMLYLGDGISFDSWQAEAMIELFMQLLR